MWQDQKAPYGASNSVSSPPTSCSERVGSPETTFWGHAVRLWQLEPEPRPPALQPDLRAPAGFPSLSLGFCKCSSPVWQITHKTHVEFLPSPSVTSTQGSHGTLVTGTAQIRPLQTPHSPCLEGTEASPPTHIQICLGQACHLSRLLFAGLHVPEVSRD